MNTALPSQKSGLAVASLVLGILSIVLCLGPLTGIPALICGIMALSRMNTAPAAQSGRGFAIAGISMGGVSFIMIPLLAAMILPAFATARSTAQEAACLNNVRQLGLMCQIYAADHDGRLPGSLEDLKQIESGTKDIARLFNCPSHRNAESGSYELCEKGRALKDIAQPAETVLIREIGPAHRNGRHAVGYVDGHVEMTTK